MTDTTVRHYFEGCQDQWQPEPDLVVDVAAARQGRTAVEIVCWCQECDNQRLTVQADIDSHAREATS